MTAITLLAVPYDSGHRAERAGRGPIHLLDHGLADVLADDGHDVQTEWVEAEPGFQTEVGTSFALYRLLADRVGQVIASGRFPVVLSGNCGASLGTVAGANTDKTGNDLGVVWLDAHGDFNTPDTTATGFLDGMGLAAMNGLCWRTLTAQIPGFAPVDGGRIVHVAGRDFDTEEPALFASAGVAVLDANMIRQSSLEAALLPVLRDMEARVRRVYFHLDLDVLDADTVGRANQFACPNGLDGAQVKTAIDQVQQRFQLAALGVTSYDPAHDTDGRVRQVAVDVIRHVADLPNR